MTFFLMAVGLFALWVAPVIWIWCIRPGKSLQDGLRAWLDESSDDI